MTSDVAASIRARLLNQAKANGEEFERTLTRFAAERLLFRLGASTARDRCILKGASLLAVWMSDPFRATRDVDVLASGATDDAEIKSLIEGICSVECSQDAIRFDLSQLTLETIRAEEEYVGKRARFHAYLGNARIRVQIDFGFGDALTVIPQELELPKMLPALPAARVRCYPREATIAEKFEAMVKLDTRNSRMKDFHDVWALSGAFVFDGPSLLAAVAACFERRATTWPRETPSALTSAFYQDSRLETLWRRYLAAGMVLTPPPAQFDVVGERIIGFLRPMWDSILGGASFDSTWKPGGPWVLRYETSAAS